MSVSSAYFVIGLFFCLFYCWTSWRLTVGLRGIWGNDFGVHRTTTDNTGGRQGRPHLRDCPPGPNSRLSSMSGSPLVPLVPSGWVPTFFPLVPDVAPGATDANRCQAEFPFPPFSISAPSLKKSKGGVLRHGIKITLLYTFVNQISNRDYKVHFQEKARMAVWRKGSEEELGFEPGLASFPSLLVWC